MRALRFRRTILVAAFLLGVFLLAPSARADCQQTGASVLCTGSDPDGFLASFDSLSLRVAPGAQVGNIVTDETLGVCPLSFPAIALGGDSSATNEGFIFGGGVCGWGILLGDRGTVLNAGTILTIDSVGFGIIAGEDALITNNGRIDTQGMGSRGILGGARNSITNIAGGTIATTGTGASAVDVGANAIVVNHGLLTTSGAIAHGIDAGADGALTNLGTIFVTGGQSIGMRAMGGDPVVTNAATVHAVFGGQVDAPAHGAGIDTAGESVSITNSGTVDGSFAGIRLSATRSISVANTGFVTAMGEFRTDGAIAPGGGAIVFTAAPDADVGITNSGQITGLNGSAAIRGDGGRTVIVSTGAISGDVILGDGGDSLTLNGGSTFAGTFDGGGGGDFLYLNGSGLLSASFTHVENLLETGGGTWIVEGAPAFTSQANILGGVLQLGGVFQNSAELRAPQTNILAAGTLRGSGTIEGALTNSGTVAPGLSDAPGLLAVTGDFTQLAGGNLMMRLNPTGVSDQLVVSGRVNLGGTLRLQYQGEIRTAPLTSAVFDLIVPSDSTLTVSGSFATIVTDSIFLQPRLVAAPSGAIGVTVDRLAYGSIALTRTQSSTGALLDRLQSSPPALLAPGFDDLNAATADSARALFDQLGPESASALHHVGLFTVASIRESLMRALRQPPASAPWRAWGDFFGRGGRTRGQSGGAAYGYDLRGGIAGVERTLGGGTRLGLAIARSDGDANFTATPAVANFGASFVGVTAAHVWSHIHLAAGLSYGGGHPRQRRTQTVAGSTQFLAARPHADLWSAFATASFVRQIGPLTVAPRMGLAYDRIDLGPLDETAPLSLKALSSMSHTLRAEAGVQAIRRKGDVRPYLAVASSLDLLHDRLAVPALLNGVADGALTIYGARPRRAAVEISGGVLVDLAPNLTAHAGGRIVANDAFAGRGASAGLSWRW